MVWVAILLAAAPADPPAPAVTDSGALSQPAPEAGLADPGEPPLADPGEPPLADPGEPPLADPGEPPLADPAAPVVAEPAPDPELARLSHGLDALLAGSAPDDLTVAVLLGGAVPPADAIRDRIDSLEQALEQPATEGLSAQEQVNARVRRTIFERQRETLKRLERVYERMPRPALRAFELLTHPRTPIRTQVTAVADLETALAGLLTRLQTLDDLLAAGRLVGFRSEHEPARRRLEVAANELTTLRERASMLKTELESLANAQELTGRSIHEMVLRAIAAGSVESACDQLYQQHGRELRRLRNTAPEARASHEAIARQAARAHATLTDPAAVVDVFAAERAIGEVQELSAELITLLGKLGSAPQSWALAFERELVTLIEPLTSPATREQAQKITTEIVEEIRIEAIDGWSRVAAWARSYPEELRAFAINWRDYVREIVTVLVLLILAVLFGTRRITPMRWLVRRLARWPWLRRHLGLVVRSGNLLQTVFPSLSVYVLAYLALDVIGFERPVAQFSWVFVHWIGLFWIGRQVVQGVTRPVARGRPALVTASPATAELVRVTYSRVGLIFAAAFLIDEIAANWFGAGHMRALVDLVAFVWTGAWALWAALAWRERLARAWAGIATRGSRAHRLAEWMQRNRLGAPLSPVALVRVAVHRALTGAWWILDRTGVTTYLRAKSLRRLAQEEATDSHAIPGKLPEEYVREFPLTALVGDQVDRAVPRPEAVGPIQTHLDAWRDKRTDGSVVLIGEKGAGKTTLLAQLAASLDDEVITHTWARKAISEEQVVRELAPLVGPHEARDVNALIEAARAGPDRVVFIDEAHNVFLRTIDGYRGLDALVELVNGTHEKVFWVLAFNTFAWEFLNQSRGRAHYFRRLVWLGRWSNDELMRLIDERNRRSGFTVEFDPVILDADADTRDFQLVESADGFFRLLWEASGGNPRVAIYLWLQSVQVQFGSIRAKLFRQPTLEKVTGLTDDMVFVLASLCQHENLSIEDLGVVLRMKSGRARFTIQFLREAGIIEQTEGGDSYSLAPRYYRQTLRFLRSRHLLFEAS